MPGAVHAGADTMLLAFLLGFMGSLGHCVGMCSGVVLLLSRHGGASGRRLLLAHLGRITMYGLLGLGAGALGRTMTLALPGLRQIQGALALLAAAIAAYLALALLGRVPSPEIYLAGLSRWWGRGMHRLTVGSGGPAAPGFTLGLMWGILPCGLVLTALLTAAVAGSPWHAALTMFAFGLGTWPALFGVGWASRHRALKAAPWPRQATALVVLLFGVQMALRGMAAWGWMPHLRLGGIMLW